MSAPRVLVVDDNVMNTTLAQAVLQADGFEVACAGNAQEALQVLDGFQPELILMDIQMPGMDGLQLTRLLKSQPQTQSITIVAFTAFAMRGDEDKMRSAGCDGYLSKPIDVKSFAQQVRALMARPPYTGGVV